MADAKRKLLIEIAADGSKVDKGVKEAEGALGRLDGTVKKLGGVFAGAFAASKIFDFAGDSVAAASDLNEEMSKAQVIFGDAAKSIYKFGDTAAKSLGQSKQQAIAASSTFALFGKSAGLAGDDLVGFSTDMVGLASDMASFSNTSPEEAIFAIGAALRGESEPIRKYGVLLDDATLKARAMKLGIYDGTGVLTAQQKVLAAQAEILAQTSSAQGDFARTSGGLANQQRIMAAQFTNVKAELGAKLLPVMIKVVSWINDSMIPAIKTTVAWFQENFPKGIHAVQEAFDRIWPYLENVIRVFRGVFETIQGIVQLFIDVFTGKWGKLWDDVLGIFNGVRDMLVGLVGALWEELKLAAETAGKALLTALWAGIKFVAENVLYPYFVGIPLKVLALFKDANVWLFNKGKDVVLGAVRGLEDGWTTGFNWFVNLPGKILGAVGDGGRILKDWGTAMVKGLWEAIKAAWNWLADKVTFTLPKFHIKGTDIDIGGGSVALLPHLAKGAMNFGGGLAVVGERGPEVVALPRGSNVYPNTGAGGGPTYNVVINAGIGTDPVALERAVTDAITRNIRRNGTSFLAA